MKIPASALSPESLRGIIEEYVTREGTEYGDRDYSLDEKVDHVMTQLKRKEIIIEYDPDSQTCTLVSLQQR